MSDSSFSSWPPGSAEENFEVACSFLGWGDPGNAGSPGIWFVGLEEGGEAWTEETVAKYRSHVSRDYVFEVANETPEPGSGSVDSWMSKIACSFSSRYAGRGWRDAWREYKANVLWRAGSAACLTNRYPLGKPRLGDWPTYYKRLFGFGVGPRERRAYREATYAKRFPKIRARWFECSPQATICFGESGWSDFRRLFELDEHPAVGRVCTYAEQRILLIPFLGPAGPKGPMSHKIVDAIVDELRKWSVRLP